MRKTIFMAAMLLSSVAFAGQTLPTVGPAPTAAGKGVTTNTIGGAQSTNKGATMATATGFGNPSAMSFGNSAAGTSGNGVVRAPAAALTSVAGSSGGGAAAAVGVGNVSSGATAGVHNP